VIIGTGRGSRQVDKMLRCSRCKTEKPASAFALNVSRASGHQGECRSCRVAINVVSYLRARDVQNPKRYAWKARRVAQNQEWILDYLTSRWCVDCGNTDVRVLEFDHLRDKEANISALMNNSSIARMQAEIAKCDVVCANCHRIRTYARAGSRRHVHWLARQP